MFVFNHLTFKTKQENLDTNESTLFIVIIDHQSLSVNQKPNQPIQNSQALRVLQPIITLLHHCFIYISQNISYNRKIELNINC